MNSSRPINDPRQKLKISKARYHLIPVLSDLFTKRAFSGHKIDHTLKENHLSAEDRALFTELFYGFLRLGHRLLYFVDQFLSDPSKLPDKIKWILAIGFYQKLYLTKIPDHAIANEAVEMARKYVGTEPMAQLVNAVMQKFLKHHARFLNLEEMPLWVQTSFPEWLAQYLSDQLTPMKFFQVAQALNVPSPTYIRVNVTKISEEKLLLKLKAEGVQCQQTAVPHCLMITDLSISPKDLPGYHEGLWTIQNMASQRVVRFMDIKEGETILDACAGYGGKTLQMAEMMRDRVQIFYYDLIEKKINAVEARANAMGFRHVKPVTEWAPIYDKVLIDAPCSGLGTTASHPEIKWFRSLEDLRAQPVRQLEVLGHYSEFVKVGGSVFYAVCSIDKNEGPEVIRQFVEAHPNFVVDETLKTPFINSAQGTMMLPTDKGESGYFFSRLLRRS